MAAQLEINWTDTETMLQSMVDVGLQANDLDTYFNEHVVSVKGLAYDKCALKPIGDEIRKLGPAFTWMRKRYQSRWVDVIRATAESAKDVDRVDSSVNMSLGRYLGDLDKIEALPDFKLNVKFFDVEDLTLEEPGEGKETMKHDGGWEIASEGYDKTRDGINDAIDSINSLGVSLPKLSEKSLEDYIIYPLSGNYKLLQGNAEACGHCDTGFGEWALNFARLGGQVTVAMKGQTANKLAAHMGLYGVVMVAIGEVIGKGSKIFDEIARMSERIAVRVEKALVKLTTKLSKLVTKLSSKFTAFGWVIFAAEVIEKGWEAVTDIYDDIMACKDIITACFGLAEEIKAWAEVMADSLEKMKQIKEMVENLPKVQDGGDLSDLPKIDLPAVEKDLGEIDVELTDDSEEEQDLEDRLDDLDTDTEESTEEEIEVPEGTVLMAPGPLGPEGPSTTTGTMA